MAHGTNQIEVYLEIGQTRTLGRGMYRTGLN